MRASYQGGVFYVRTCKTRYAMQLRLRRFDISSIEDDKVVVLIGKRDTGKSFLVRDLLYHHRDIPVGTVISPTESANKFYSNIVPSMFIHDEYTQPTLNNVVKRQKLIVKRIEDTVRSVGSCDIDPRSFLILDDCLYDSSWIKDPNIRLLFMNGRHYKMMFVITMQYPLGIPPNLRTNIDYVFILRENITGNRKRIYENYAGMFPSFDIFCQVMDQCTENYECLVIHTNAKSNKLEDQVFWYKAEPRPTFQMCPQYWLLDRETAAWGDDEFDESGGDVLTDLTSIVKRRGNTPQINVKKSIM